ncbi:MAG: SDR family oxidoreductase [Candidatus Limnocylindrales bacterium]
MTRATAHFALESFAGRHVLVTGGGTGIGRATALAFAELGADVALVGRRREPLAAVAEEIRSLGRRAVALPANVREPDQVESAFSQAADELGGLHVVVNNAGGQFPARAEEISVNGWRAVVDLNLNGTFYCCRTALPLLEASGGGAIVNMSANFIVRPVAGLAHSIAARSGVAHLTAALALEWATRGIRVNCIAPGTILTEGATREMAPTRRHQDRLIKTVPMGRWGTPDEVALSIVFLASDAASYLTGVTLVLDGGAHVAGGSIPKPRRAQGGAVSARRPGG